MDLRPMNWSRKAFGDNWCGPDALEHATQTLIASYTAENEDGADVQVFCTAMPALFFRLQVEPSATNKGYAINTGSGVGKWAADTAKMIAQGMAGVHLPTTPESAPE